MVPTSRHTWRAQIPTGKIRFALWNTEIALANRHNTSGVLLLIADWNGSIDDVTVGFDNEPISRRRFELGKPGMMNMLAAGTGKADHYGLQLS